MGRLADEASGAAKMSVLNDFLEKCSLCCVLWPFALFSFRLSRARLLGLGPYTGRVPFYEP